MSRISTYLHTELDYLKANQPIASEVVKGFFASPSKDMRNISLECSKELKEDRITPKTLRLVFGSLMICDGFRPLLMQGIDRVFTDTVYDKKATYARICYAIGCFVMGWGLCIAEKAIARGLNNYRAKIEKASLDSKVAKEGTALIIFPAYDYNSAFYINPDTARNYEQLSKRFKLISATVSSTKELIKTIHSVADAGHDIKILNINGHGNPYRMVFGEGEEESVSSFHHFAPEELSGFEPDLEKALERLNPNAVIIVNGCSTAGKTKATIVPSPYWHTKNTAHRIAALAHKRMVIASPVNHSGFKIENDPASPYHGLRIHPTGAKEAEQYIQENAHNVQELDEIRSAINLARAHSDIEIALAKLKKDQGYALEEPVSLKVHASEKIKNYLQFSLQGLLGNRMGVKSVEYAPAEKAEGAPFCVLGEEVQFAISKYLPLCASPRPCLSA
jgi:hypothetical protein